MMNRTPFARSLAIMASIQAMMAAGASQMTAAIQSGAGSYKSRGKGRSGGIVRQNFGNRPGKNYPFSSAKQDRKTATRQHTVIVNGFPLMQTRRTGDRLSISQVG